MEVAKALGVTVGISRAVSETDGDFRRKSLQNSHLLYFAKFASPLKEFSLELGIGAGCKKTRMMRPLGREKSLTIYFAVWIQSTDVTDGQTDGHRATAKTALAR